MIFIIEQLSINEAMFTGCPRKPNENKSYLIKGEGGVGICVHVCWSYHCNVLED